MKPYEPWEFCKSTECIRTFIDDDATKNICAHDCGVYKFHQYLKDNGQILEEGSELAKAVAEAEMMEIQSMLKVEKERSSLYDEQRGYFKSKSDQLEADNTVIKQALINLLISHQKMRMGLDVNFEDKIAIEEYVENLVTNPHPDDSLLKELESLKAELSEGDYWMGRAKSFSENGGCLICFGTDEAGHKPGCEIAELEKLRAIKSATEAYTTWEKAICPRCEEDILDSRCNCHDGVGLIKQMVIALEAAKGAD